MSYVKNTAGQGFGFGLVNASTGAADAAATVTAYRVLDGGVQAAATGAVTNKGNGQYWFALSQADTNANVGSYLMTAAGDVPVEKTVVYEAAPVLTSGTGANQIQVDGAGAANVNLVKVLGTAPTAAAAGVLDVNAKAVNNVSTSPVTTVSAVLGTAQALVFDASNLPKVDVEDWHAVPVAVAAPPVTVGGYSLGNDPATLVLDVSASAHNSPGSVGGKINSSGSAADPLANAVPGSYPQGTAGNVLGQLLSKPITYTGPVNPVTGQVQIIRGDDYQSPERLLSWSAPAGGGVPDLTGAAIAVNFYLPYNNTPVLTLTGTATNPGTSSQGVTAPLTAAQSGGLTNPQYTVAAIATLSDGHVDTVVRVQALVSGPSG